MIVITRVPLVVADADLSGIRSTLVASLPDETVGTDQGESR